MMFHPVCDCDELWEGELAEFTVAGHAILLIRQIGGAFVAFQALCPHQDIPLAEGMLDDGVITCRAHLWQFDGKTGAGVNPEDCKLARYPVKVEHDKVHVSVDGVVPVRVGG